jgi:hypothetical protein
MDNDKILGILNALYMEEYHPHSELGVKHVDEWEGRFYAVHPDSNVISLFPPIDLPSK